ncbi:MAG: thiamine pyrophosphate-dependent enzyme [Actinomycetota bacterium]
MSASDAGLHRRLVAALDGHGVDTLFGVPGGGPNLDVVGAATAVGHRFVLAHTETAAAIMASTHGLLTGAPTGVVVTRGPGAASAVNGAAQATLDRAPLVIVTDCVPAATAERVAHQRLDQRTMLAPAVKVSATVSDRWSDQELIAVIGEACRWPFGAVHLDYDPTADVHPPTGGVRSVAPSGSTDDAALDAARSRFAAARRPVVVAGVEAAATAPSVGPLLARFGCPVLTTYQAVGLVPTEGPNAAGLFTNAASERPLLDEADLIVVVGLDPVEPVPAPWSYDADVVRLSSQPLADPYHPITHDLVGELPTLVERLLDRPAADGAGAWDPAAGAIHRESVRVALRAAPAPEPGGFGPLQLVDAAVPTADRFGTVTVDAGAHFLAIMPLWPVVEPLRLLISNGLATMGYALPAAIGAALARPGEAVLALTGDGGLSMAVAELETVARLDLPITVVVFNDAALSLIEIKQGADHGGPDAVRYGAIDFAAVARGLGLTATTVHTADELGAALERASSRGVSGGHLIDARIDPTPYRHLLTVTRG